MLERMNESAVKEMAKFLEENSTDSAYLLVKVAEKNRLLNCPVYEVDRHTGKVRNLGVVSRIKGEGKHDGSFQINAGKGRSNVFYQLRHFPRYGVVAHYSYSHWVIEYRKITGICLECIHDCMTDKLEQCDFFEGVKTDG